MLFVDLVTQLDNFTTGLGLELVAADDFDDILCVRLQLDRARLLSLRLAKRANEDWGEAAMLAALSKESLSIAADNYEESLPFVKRNVRERIKLVKMAA